MATTCSINSLLLSIQFTKNIYNLPFWVNIA